MTDLATKIAQACLDEIQRRPDCPSVDELAEVVNRVLIERDPVGEAWVKFTLEIEKKNEDGLWYVTSPQIKGLLLGMPNLDTLGDELCKHVEYVEGLNDAGDPTARKIARSEGLVYPAPDR